mmetsp:Transcript_6278/g.9476  ORF Transcript_6278/g.9476 Transcript_6278/m.9476 type:complete len:422 (-) Transcript_6278:44-1309(-)
MSSKHLLSADSGDDTDTGGAHRQGRGDQSHSLNFDNYESDAYYSADEFGNHPRYDDKVILTGRMRKKQAARLKGGEFQAKRQKRRIYFCCVSSEIDIQELHDHCSRKIYESQSKWKTRLYGDALCLSKPRVGSSTALTASDIPRRHNMSPADVSQAKPFLSTSEPTIIQAEEQSYDSSVRMVPHDLNMQEVYIFEFGVLVFWGFSVGEEKYLLDLAKDFSKRGVITGKEFESGEDDMAYVTDTDSSRLKIANDVITFPGESSSKQRLSVSYAIAQSSVVSIFEFRIERKVAEYKFIPETLANVGKIDMSTRRIGMMIGDIFVIRHDLNLHTDILDTPDYFWEEDRYEQDYEKVMKYLEMDSRVEVINKRLDMLKELLDVLHQQMENAHSTKLEWIIIWLIVLEVVIQIVGAVGGLVGIWVW